ncbi:MAG TPA: hypothetical protein VIV60_30650 [Polyangiaceae bacterium]
MHSRLSPLSVLLCGVAAGFMGSFAQRAFFFATKRMMQKDRFNEFNSKESERTRELDDLRGDGPQPETTMQGPDRQQQTALGKVHYAAGGAWGGLYGLLAASLPAACSLRGGIAFGMGVWLVSDTLVLPKASVADWPGEYPVTSHAYAMMAHAVYGTATFLTIAALDRLASRRSIATFCALWVGRKAWRPLRPTVRNVVRPTILYALIARDIARAIH